MIKSVSRNSKSSSVTLRVLRVPDWRHGACESFLTFLYVLHIWVLTWWVSNFSLLAWLKCVKNHPIIISDLEEIEGSWSLTWRIWVKGHPWPLHCSCQIISNLCTKYQHSSMIKSVSKKPCPWWDYLVMLRVPDQRHGGHGSSLTS